MLLLSTIRKLGSSKPTGLDSANDSDDSDLPKSSSPTTATNTPPTATVSVTNTTTLPTPIPSPLNPDEIPPALTHIENLAVVSTPQRRRDFVLNYPQATPVYELEESCRVEIYDVWRSTISNKLVFRWRPGRVLKIASNNSVLVAFDGFSERWDEWIPLSTGKIRSPFKGPVSTSLSSLVYSPILPIAAPQQQQQTPPSPPPLSLISPPSQRLRAHSTVSTSSSLFVEPETRQGNTGMVSLFRLKRTGGGGSSSASGGAGEGLGLTTTDPAGDLELRKRRGQSGLVNLGNTCFMNSILQSLSFIPPFVVAILELNGEEGEKREKSAVIAELSRLFREQWRSTPVHPRSPVFLRSLFADEFPHLFAKPLQQDAQEFLCVLLDHLHETSNHVKRRPTIDNLDSSSSDDDDGDGDEEEEEEEEEDTSEISTRAWNNYQRGNDSYIKDLFCGQFMSRKKCTACEKKSFTCDIFFDVQLPIALPSVTGNKSLKLEELLRDYFKSERLVELTCTRCKQKGCITKQLSIERFPCVLVIMFKRSIFPSNKKVNTVVSFPLKGLRIQSSASQQTRVYDLVSVVNHTGLYSTSGHYTSDVLHPLTRAWFQANDSGFTPLPGNQRSAVGKDAFMLFYVDSDKLKNSADFLLTVE